MADEKCFYADESSRYGEGIVLDEYNSKFSLVLANKKDEKVFLQWCYPQAKDGSRKPIEKSLPWKIELGTREQAMDILQYFLKELSAAGGTDDNGDSVPF